MTIITLSKKTETLKELVTNWNNLNKETQNFLLSSSHYVIDFQELLVYNTENKIIASCEIFYSEGVIEIENCFTAEGKLY